MQQRTPDTDHPAPMSLSELVECVDFRTLGEELYNRRGGYYSREHNALSRQASIDRISDKADPDRSTALHVEKAFAESEIAAGEFWFRVGLALGAFIENDARRRGAATMTDLPELSAALRDASGSLDADLLRKTSAAFDATQDRAGDGS